jgi:glucose-1-phosphate cytidylyltransferase
MCVLSLASIGSLEKRLSTWTLSRRVVKQKSGALLYRFGVYAILQRGYPRPTSKKPGRRDGVSPDGHWAAAAEFEGNCMFIVDTALARREAERRPVRVALIGAGYIARCIALQFVTSAAGMRLVALANRTAEKAERAWRDAGADRCVHVETVTALERAIESGVPAVTQDADLVCRSGQVDVVIEATGHVEHGTRVCFEAIRNGNLFRHHTRTRLEGEGRTVSAADWEPDCANTRGPFPKPLANIGYRPIVWHLMRYYAHFGHKDFVLCLGYRGDLIREFFLNYNECLSNDFVMSEGGRKIDLLKSDISDWRITFVDTGLHANIGQRLLRVREARAWRGDVHGQLCRRPDRPAADDHVDKFLRSGAVGSFIAVRTSQSFHSVQSDTDGWVSSMGRIKDSEFWINAGFFVFRPEIYEYIEEGDELVEQPFNRLIERRKLYVNRYTGFWQQMDTFREKILYDRMEARGDCPWMVWRK